MPSPPDVRKARCRPLAANDHPGGRSALCARRRPCPLSAGKDRTACRGHARPDWLVAWSSADRRARAAASASLVGRSVRRDSTRARARWSAAVLPPAISSSVAPAMSGDTPGSTARAKALAASRWESGGLPGTVALIAGARREGAPQTQATPSAGRATRPPSVGFSAAEGWPSERCRGRARVWGRRSQQRCPQCRAGRGPPPGTTKRSAPVGPATWAPDRRRAPAPGGAGGCRPRRARRRAGRRRRRPASARRGTAPGRGRSRGR